MYNLVVRYESQLRVAELKNGLQVQNEDVVEARDEAPQEEQRGHGAQDRGVARGGGPAGQRSNGRGRRGSRKGRS